MKNSNGWQFAGDDLPPRDVFVDGRKVDKCLKANERLGKVVAFRIPLRLDKYKTRFLTRTLYGKVEVIFK